MPNQVVVCALVCACAHTHTHTLVHQFHQCPFCSSSVGNQRLLAYAHSSSIHALASLFFMLDNRYQIRLWLTSAAPPKTRYYASYNTSLGAWCMRFARRPKRDIPLGMRDIECCKHVSLKKSWHQTWTPDNPFHLHFQSLKASCYVTSTCSFARQGYCYVHIADNEGQLGWTRIDSICCYCSF